MSSNNSIIGFVPVAIYDCYGNIAEVLYRPIFADVAVPTIESTAPAEAHVSDEEWEAVEALRLAAEALERAKEVIAEFGEDPDLDPQEMRIINDLKEAIASDNGEKAKEALQDWEVRVAFDEGEDKEEEELAHVAQLMKEEAQEALVSGEKQALKETLVNMVALYDTQKVLYNRHMAAVEKKRAGGKFTPGFWENWNKLLGVQTKWRDAYKRALDLVSEIKLIDPEFTMQPLAYECDTNPEKKVGCNYEAEFANMNRTFLNNLGRYKKPAAAETRASERTTTLDEYVMPHVGGA